MHAGKRPYGLLRCDDVTEMQVGGLDAPEDAAGQHSPARLAWRMTRKMPPPISIEETRLGLHSSPTRTSACIYSSTSSLTLIAASQARHVSGTDPATGNPEARSPRKSLKAA
jgi:hypothetical protein